MIRGPFMLYPPPGRAALALDPPGAGRLCSYVYDMEKRGRAAARIWLIF